MSQQRIIVEISEGGEVIVEAQGVSGAGCQALTKAIEESLGETKVDRKKAEFFQKQTIVQQAGAKR